MINCPYHDDHTPSMKIYGEVAYCFVCSISVPVTELKLNEKHKYVIPEPTNVPERIKYIKSLPTKMIRGLQLPYDDSGFYVMWPQENYYKKRNNEGKTRYIGPSGVKAPLLVCPGTFSHLVIVEGEMNALSLYSIVWDGYKIVSPGSASELMRHIKYYLVYSKITVIVDNDAAGVVFGYQLKEILLKNNKSVTLCLMNKDFNQHLQDGGEEAVKQKFEECL